MIISEVTTEMLLKARKSARRSKASAACLHCRSSKVKCTGFFPCAVCLKISRVCLAGTVRKSLGGISNGSAVLKNVKLLYADVLTPGSSSNLFQGRLSEGTQGPETDNKDQRGQESLNKTQVHGYFPDSPAEHEFNFGQIQRLLPIQVPDTISYGVKGPHYDSVILSDQSEPKVASGLSTNRPGHSFEADRSELSGWTCPPRSWISGGPGGEVRHYDGDHECDYLEPSSMPAD